MTPLLLGMGFGFLLERGGMSNAPKLAGQFTATDFTVLRLMFSAIVTAMLGLFWLGRLGLLDISRVFVPETFVLAQAIGGAIFGIGFATAGLCPGTSCVAAATGRIDGVAVMAGLCAGVFAFHESFAALRPLYEAMPRGPETLPGLTHLPYGTVVALVVVLGLAAFFVASRIERR